MSTARRFAGCAAASAWIVAQLLSPGAFAGEASARSLPRPVPAPRVARAYVAAPRARVWRRARVPGYAKAQSAFVAAQRAQTPRFITGPTLAPVLFHQAALLLELAGGALLPDAEVVGYLGYLLVHAEVGRELAARDLLLDALRTEQAPSLRVRMLFALAIAANRLGEGEAELEAYEQALELEWDTDHRATLSLNRAESLMAAGRLKEAVERYRDALGGASGPEHYALASFGLALGLARSGELPEALQHAGRAARAQIPVAPGQSVMAIELPSVFFTPTYEIEAYRAIAWMGLAAEAAKPDAQQRLTRAVAHWDLFIRGAARADGRWVPSARQLRQWCLLRLDQIGLAR